MNTYARAATNPAVRTSRDNEASELPTRMESTSARGTTTRQLSQSSGRGKGIPRSESARTTSPYMRDTCPARQTWAIWCRDSARESSTGIRRHPVEHALSRSVTARHPATARCSHIAQLPSLSVVTSSPATLGRLKPGTSDVSPELDQLSIGGSGFCTAREFPQRCSATHTSPLAIQQGPIPRHQHMHWPTLPACGFR